MERRALGRSDIEVTRVVLGCGNFGGLGSAPSTWGMGTQEDEARRVMDAAWEAGVRAFDTASSYGGGASERMIGRWRAERETRGLVVTSKAYWPVHEGDDRGLAPERLSRVARESRERLGVERIDLFLTHERDPETPLLDTLRALDGLVDDGVVGAFGVSNADASYVEECLSIAREHGLRRIECVQNEYSLLARDAERDVLPLCSRERIAFTAFSPLAGGWLTGKYRRGEAFPADSRMSLRPDERFPRDEVYDAVEAFAERAGERGVAPATLALAWLLGEERVTAAIVGPSRLTHLAPALAALGLDLSQAERDDLAALFT